MRKLCLIFNTAPLYRQSIYTLIDNVYDCDWYFGEKIDDIQEMDYSLLKSVRRYSTWGNRSRMYWMNGIVSLLWKKEYKTFFMLAESRCLTDYLFFFLARLCGKRVYVWTHGWYGKENKIEGILKRWMFNHVDGIFSYSNYSRNLLIGQGISEDRVFTIHNSLDYNRHKALRNGIVLSDIYKEHFHNDNPVVIFIGRLTKVKKLDLLIDSLAVLKDRGESYNLVFVGDGTECENLKRKVKSAGVEDTVWFYGASYDENKNAELLYNADLCVSPGNVGLTAIHAMTFGCPVITHNCFKWQMPEFEAICSGITGDFFEMDNVNSLANSISRWFANKLDKRDEVRNACFREIDTQWNPAFQMNVILQNLKML